jgi:hypothetical protein
MVLFLSEIAHDFHMHIRILRFCCFSRFSISPCRGLGDALRDHRQQRRLVRRAPLVGPKLGGARRADAEPGPQLLMPE